MVALPQTEIDRLTERVRKLERIVVMLVDAHPSLQEKAFELLQSDEPNIALCAGDFKI